VGFDLESALIIYGVPTALVAPIYFLIMRGSTRSARWGPAFVVSAVLLGATTAVGAGPVGGSAKAVVLSFLLRVLAIGWVGCVIIDLARAVLRNRSSGSF
jgi:hypothetical protein